MLFFLHLSYVCNLSIPYQFNGLQNKDFITQTENGASKRIGALRCQRIIYYLLVVVTVKKEIFLNVLPITVNISSVLWGLQKGSCVCVCELTSTGG